MPKVTLISYTGHGNPDPLYAAKLLAYTKSTRLNMTPEGFGTFMKMGEIPLSAELDYMSKTIPSSWEFADLIFSIEKVSRATAQQITRTRTASFAMQSQRVTDMSDVTWDSNGPVHDHRMRSAVANYTAQVEEGTSLEDARDLLPIGVHCNLIAKYNLRNWVELVRARDSLRVQGPYREVIQQMKAEVAAAWPWIEVFLEPKQAKAIAMVEQVARELSSMAGEKGAMYKGLSGTLAKAADLLKKD